MITANLAGIILCALAMWFFSDGVYSWTLYLNAPSYEGSKRQTFLRDHWVRLTRIIGSFAVEWLGILLITGGVS